MGKEKCNTAGIFFKNLGFKNLGATGNKKGRRRSVGPESSCIP
jgi:hypothetical protein